MKCFWYSFLLEAESSPRPQCDRKDYVNEKSSDTFGNRSRDLPVCSAVPQLLRHRVPPTVHINKINSDSCANDGDENTKFKITNKSNFKKFITFKCLSQDSSVGIATRYVPDGTEIESRWGEISRNCSHRLWGPPSLQYNGYRIVPGSKAVRA
jgi:hypothetical protein